MRSLLLHYCTKTTCHSSFYKANQEEKCHKSLTTWTERGEGRGGQGGFSLSLPSHALHLFIGKDTQGALTHGGQPLGAKLRGVVGEVLREVCGGRPVTFAHIVVVGVIWGRGGVQTNTHMTLSAGWVLNPVHHCIIPALSFFCFFPPVFLFSNFFKWWLNRCAAMRVRHFFKFFFFTCAVYVVGPSDHLLYDLSSDAPHVLSDLDPSGLDHEHILVHCGQKKMERRTRSLVAVRYRRLLHD